MKNSVGIIKVTKYKDLSQEAKIWCKDLNTSDLLLESTDANWVCCCGNVFAKGASCDTVECGLSQRLYRCTWCDKVNTGAKQFLSCMSNICNTCNSSGKAGCPTSGNHCFKCVAVLTRSKETTKQPRQDQVWPADTIFLCTITNYLYICDKLLYLTGDQPAFDSDDRFACSGRSYVYRRFSDTTSRQTPHVGGPSRC